MIGEDLDAGLILQADIALVNRQKLGRRRLGGDRRVQCDQGVADAFGFLVRFA